VRIGVGRDAADAAFATIWGSAVLKAKTVVAEMVTDDALAPDGDALAISMA
jgi:hypothetical protein